MQSCRGESGMFAGLWRVYRKTGKSFVEAKKIRQPQLVSAACCRGSQGSEACMRQLVPSNAVLGAIQYFQLNV